jgi:hypothetical protein
MRAEGRVKVKEKQVFSVLVRGLGILVFLHGLSSLYVDLAQWEFEPAVTRTFVTAMIAPNVIYSLLAVVLGITMVRWPQWLVHLAWLERLPTIGRMTDDEISH